MAWTFSGSNTSRIEPDWSNRNKIMDGTFRLISTVCMISPTLWDERSDTGSCREIVLDKQSVVKQKTWPGLRVLTQARSAREKSVPPEFVTRPIVRFVSEANRPTGLIGECGFADRSRRWTVDWRILSMGGPALREYTQTRPRLTWVPYARPKSAHKSPIRAQCARPQPKIRYNIPYTTPGKERFLMGTK